MTYARSSSYNRLALYRNEVMTEGTSRKLEDTLSSHFDTRKKYVTNSLRKQKKKGNEINHRYKQIHEIKRIGDNRDNKEM